MSKNTLSFEDMLKLFTDMDTDEKATFFHQKLKIFLDGKTEDERHFVGSIFLSLTRDNAAQLLRSIEQKGDIALLEKMQHAITEFT